MTLYLRLGRIMWKYYLLCSLPAVCGCIALLIARLAALYLEIGGPPESHALGINLTLLWISAAALPLVWILGLTLGHHFNGRRSVSIPFLANAIPVAGLLLSTLPLRTSVGAEALWPITYWCLLIALLGIGLFSVAMATLRSAPPEVGPSQA